MGEVGSAKDLASFLGVSQRTVRELAERNIAVRATRKGTYDLTASVRAYCAHLRDVAAGRGGEDKVAALTSERARLAREQADAAALKNATLRGTMLPAAAVELEWAEILRTVRAGMLAVPSRVQQRAGHLTAAEVAIIDREVRDVLSELGGGPDAG